VKFYILTAEDNQILDDLTEMPVSSSTRESFKSPRHSQDIM